MALKLLSAKIVPVTHDLAKRYRDMKPLKNERPLKKVRAKEQIKLLEDGKFFTAVWGECEYNGTIFRGNGNHTSHEITACFQAHNGGLDEKSESFVTAYLFAPGGKWSGETTEDLPKLEEGQIKALVEKFHADEPDDLVEFFRRYDAKESARSVGDILGIHVGEFDDLDGLERKKIGYALAGVLRSAKADPEVYGLTDAGVLSRYQGAEVGHALKLPRVRAATKFIVETVPHEYLYSKIAGAQVFAELWSKEGDDKAEKVINEVVRQLEEDEEPAASWEAALNKKRNRPTLESLVKKGRTVLRMAAENV
jgi:hypothetical protein